MTDLGFTWVARKTGEVQVFHRGAPAATLRGAKAARFLALCDRGPEAAIQQEAARLTGNYKRGNERQAKGHARNA